jgi:tyrosyl-tRNA synthetase
MWEYYELLTEVSLTEIEAMKASRENPINFKKEIAFLITKDFHSAEDAEKAVMNWVNQVSKGNLPEEIEEKTIREDSIVIIELILKTGLVQSKGEAKRLIQQGGVKIDGEKVTNLHAEISLSKLKKLR